MAAIKTGSRLIAPAPLTTDHDLRQFDCGRKLLNYWLRDHALISEGRTARTYVVCEARLVMGYYCISAGSVDRGELPSKLKRARGMPKQHVPVTIIGRLARDVRYRGTGLGADLLRDALSRIVVASRVVGSRAVLVHALDDNARQFWLDHEFIECPVGSRTFFLPIETAVDAL